MAEHRRPSWYRGRRRHPDRWTRPLAIAGEVVDDLASLISGAAVATMCMVITLAMLMP